MKDTDEQADEELYMWSARVQSTVPSVFMELGCVILQVYMCLPAWKLSESHAVRILWRFPRVGIS